MYSCNSNHSPFLEHAEEKQPMV